MFDLYQRGKFVKKISAEDIENFYLNIPEKDKYAYLVINKDNIKVEKPVENNRIAEAINFHGEWLVSLHFHVCENDDIVHEYEWAFHNEIIFLKESKHH